MFAWERRWSGSSTPPMTSGPPPRRYRRLDVCGHTGIRTRGGTKYRCIDISSSLIDWQISIEYFSLFEEFQYTNEGNLN